MNKKSKIYVAGGQTGLVGSSICRLLKKEGYTNIVVKSRKELDLINNGKVEEFFSCERPEYVFLAAAKVGGILANYNNKGDFIYDNLAIQNNVIYNAWKYKVKKLLFLGSSCIYPKYSLQPIKEEYFFTGELEETNKAYAIAKIAGITLCQSMNEQYKTNFISVMPCNLYGPNDNFDLETSHVLPAFIRKFHEAKIEKKKNVILWGTGSAFREFLYVDDVSAACIFLMKYYNSSEIINIGSGQEIKIKDLAQLIKRLVGYKGKIKWDSSKPNGTPKKLLNNSKLFKLGWKPEVSFEQGLELYYSWFIENYRKITQL